MVEPRRNAVTLLNEWRRFTHWSNPQRMREARAMMTLAEQISLAKQTRTYLDERRSREGMPFDLQLAYSGASTLVGAALATAAGAKSEIVARGALAGMIGSASTRLGEFQAQHPEYHDEIGTLPGQLALIADDVKA